MQAAAGAGPNGKPPITIQGLASPRATGTRTSSRRHHRRRPTSDDSVRHLRQKTRLLIQPKEKRPPPTPSTPTRCKYGCGCWFLKRNLCVFEHNDEDHLHHLNKMEKIKELIELNTKEKLARVAARSPLGDLTNAKPAADNTCSSNVKATANEATQAQAQAAPQAAAPGTTAPVPERSSPTTQPQSRGGPMANMYGAMLRHQERAQDQQDQPAVMPRRVLYSAVYHQRNQSKKPPDSDSDSY